MTDTADKLRLVLAEIEVGAGHYCQDHWYPGVPVAQLRQELRALELKEQSAALGVLTQVWDTSPTTESVGRWPHAHVARFTPAALEALLARRR
jgi:hypothetical protein